MLVLSREKEEDVVILLPDGRKIVVAVIEIVGGKKARLGFVADNDITILRGDLYSAFDCKKREAAAAAVVAKEETVPA